MNFHKLIAVLILSFSLTAKAQIISTIAGNGTYGYSGDGGQATNAELYTPRGVAFDAAGNMYIADPYNNRIRMVNTLGIISTIAGNGTAAHSGDGGAAMAAEIYQPFGVAFDAVGNLYIVENGGHRIRMVNTSGIISTVAGNGTQGYSGDGGAANIAELNSPYGVAVDATGNLYIVDTFNNRIRKVNTAGIINTIVSNGTTGYSGDGGQATDAELNLPIGVAVDATGNLYIADSGNNVIRKVNTIGIISTVAGDGPYGSPGSYGGDGGAATSAELYYPYGVVIDATGNLYIADYFNNRIRMVNTSGIISTFAGNGTGGYAGDGGLASAAELSYPEGVTFDALGNLYIADANNQRIRLVCFTSCSTTTGIGQFVNNNVQISVYPNPNSGSFSIINSSNIDELKVTDILGQIVYESKPQSINTNLTIDNSGVYFITITTGKEITTKKVIVNK